MKTISLLSKTLNGFPLKTFATIFSYLLLIQITICQESRIYGGEEADIRDYPWQVSLEVSGTHNCGGTIVNNEWIVTAAHCLTALVASDITVHAGSTDQTNNNLGQRIVADGLYTYSFNLLTGENDIAILHLSTPLCFNEYVQPIQYGTSGNLDAGDDNVGSPTWISGWGHIDETYGVVEDLRAVEIPIISNLNADSIMDDPDCGLMTSFSTVLALFEADKASGPGDSGGPAIIRKTDETPILIGVCSWSCHKENKDFPSIYTKVKSYTEFFEDHEVFYDNSCGDYCEDDRDIEEDTDYDRDMIINGDVIVHTGNVLTITSTIQFTEDHGIIVERGAKLIVDGGVLTKCSEAENWRGINVEGFSDGDQLDEYDDPIDIEKAGTVVLLDATISFAINAITTYNNQYSWPTVDDYFGGLIYCENSFFHDCNRAVAFMKYGNTMIEDKSKFIHCTFEDLQLGVSLWANNGVTFLANNFNNCSKAGILAFDSGINVFGCTFDKNLDAIELFNTNTPPFSSQIGSIGADQNIFTDNHYGIYGNSQGSITAVNIQNNRFEENDFGIFLAGQSRFNITANHFEDLAISEEMVATGDNENVIAYNYTESNLIGTSFVYKNEGSTFQHNCYVESNNLDVLLNNSSIRSKIGNSSYSAGNCFTKNSIPSIYCNANLTPVIYYSYGNSSSCYYPIITSCSNVSRQSATNVITINCDSIDNPFVSPVSNCIIPETDEDKLEEINDFDDLISAVRVNSSLTTQEKIDLISEYSTCQSTVIYAYVESTLENSEDEFNEVIDNLVEFLDERPEFKYKIIALGLEIYSRRYTDALYYLNGLTTVSEEEIDFVTVENYNINYLKDWVNYIPTSGALDTLYEIGMKTHPYTGFARSLYYQLTDEILQLEIPDISGITLPRSSNSTETGLVIKSYPNPLQGDTYNIEFSGEKSSVSAHITVYNIFGEIIKSFNTQIHDNGIFPINTEKWPSNIYFLTVESELGDLLYSCKFIKM